MTPPAPTDPGPDPHGAAAGASPAAAPDGAGPAIEVAGLTIRYGDVTAVQGVTFSVPTGCIFALLGPNGAGKTSTVEALEGYRRPVAGTVRVLGLDPGADHAALTRRVGVMLQDGGVYTGAKPPEVLRLFASYYDDPLDPAELLARVGLERQARTTWRHLSGGERQRLSLALAMVGRPDLVFLDEPTAGIDVGGRQLIRAIIADLRASGVTVVLTTHDLDEAERLADHVVIIDRGRVLAAGSPAELRAGGAGEEIRFGAPPGLDLPALGAALGGAVEELAPGEYRARVAPSPTAVAALTNWLAAHDLALADLRAGRQRLEDVFLRLTEEAGGDEAGDDDREAGLRASGRGRRRRAGR